MMMMGRGGGGRGQMMDDDSDEEEMSYNPHAMRQVKEGLLERKMRDFG